jgi:hypothetical protein
MFIGLMRIAGKSVFAHHKLEGWRNFALHKLEDWETI